MYLFILTLAVCFTEGNGINCYRCEESDLSRCTTIVECSSKESCSATVNPNLNGNIHYSLGCANDTICYNLAFGKRSVAHNTIECCKTNVCNKNLFPSTTLAATTQAATTPVPCVDKIPNRHEYDADLCTNPLLRVVREVNCRRFCGICKSPSTTVPCVDKISNCYKYDADLCTNSLYRLFREDNCRKFYGLCQSPTTVSI